MSAIALLLSLAGWSAPAAAQATGCTQMYAVQRNLSGAQHIYTFTAPGILGSPGVATPATIGAAAVDPATGYLYYYGVTSPTDNSATLAHTNTLYRYDPVMRVSTLVGVSNMIGVAAGIAAGAAFDNSGNVLYVLFSGQGTGSSVRGYLARVNKSTGVVLSSTPLSGDTPNTSGTNPGGRPRDVGVIGDLIVTADGTMYYYGKDRGAGIDRPAYMRIDPTTGVLSGRVTIDYFYPRRKLGLGSSNSALSDYIDGAAIDAKTGYRYATTTEEGLGGIYQIAADTNDGITGQMAVEGLTDMGGCVLPVNRPTVQKAFSPSTIPTGMVSTLTITLHNSNAGPITLSSVLTDTFPTGVVAAATPALGGTCFTPVGNSSLISSTSNTVRMAAGLLVPGTTYNGTGGCTITINVTAAAAGTYTNTIGAGAYSTSAGSNAAAGSASLLVQARRTLTLTNTWVNAIDGDTATLTPSGTETVIGTPVVGTSVASGATTNGSLVTVVGKTVDLASAITVGASANYTTNLTCTGGNLTYTAGALTGSLVMPDANVTCTFTHTRVAVGTLTLNKSWVDGVVNNAVSLDTTGVGTGVAGTSVNGGATTAATRTIYTEETVTLSEAFTTGTANSYATTLSCTGGVLTYTKGALSGTVLVPNTAGDIACTFNNTGSVKLSASKAVSPALVVGKASTYTITVSNNGTGPTTEETRTVDTVDATLTIGAVSAGCSVSGQTVTCVTAAGGI
ncbi:MAG: hypothetical protein LBL59_10495, partial [Xanthomonadaceae bacterium]|nr:hypothetical protein [Xanthomonadaceae bacterium]